MARMLFRRLPKHALQCTACSHFCTILPGRVGKCGIRKNENGKLRLLVYGRPLGLHLDPIEKKPLFHFLPGTDTLSFGTFGCNFSCPFCQNWHMSHFQEMGNLEDLLADIPYVKPDEVVEKALELGARSISFTYNEPAIFMEYALDIMKAGEGKLKFIFVSNGFLTDFSRRRLKLLDAANIDLKSMNDKTYREFYGGYLEPVLKTIRYLHKKGKWVEVTTLLIPGINDMEEEIREIARFIHSVDPSLPWHISRYFPAFKFRAPPTPPETLEMAYRIGKEEGLKHVYVGNIPNEHESTICPSCGSAVIERQGFEVLANLLSDGKCPFCGEVIKGVWD